MMGGLAIDGHDAWPSLAHGAPSPTEAFHYYSRGRLEAVRRGRYKLVFDNPMRTPPVSRALYDLEEDVGETTDVATQHPQHAAAQLDQIAQRMRIELGDVITSTQGTANRPAGLIPEDEVVPAPWMP